MEDKCLIDTPYSEYCSVCGVRIERGITDKVFLSNSPQPVTKGKLWARVCNYIQLDSEKFSSCLNQEGMYEDIKATDYYYPR